MVKQITLAQVSILNIIRDEARNEWLEKTVPAYYNLFEFNEFVVEDIAPDASLKAAVILKREVGGIVERGFGYICKGGFAILVAEMDENPLAGYEKYLRLFEQKKVDFDCGIEVRVSKDLVQKLKAPVLAIQDKLRAYEGLFGRLKEAKPLKAFEANDKGCIRTELEDGAVTVKIDTRAVMFVAEMAADYTDYCCRKAAALMALLDFSDFAYKAKEKMARFKKEVEDPLK